MPVFSNIVAIPFSFNCQKQDYNIKRVKSKFYFRNKLKNIETDFISINKQEYWIKLMQK